MEPEKEYELRELTKEEANIFIMLQNMTDETLQEKMFSEMIESEEGFPFQVARKRFHAYELETDKRVLIMLVFLVDNIGELSKHVDIIAGKASHLNLTKITWNDFAKKIYAHGIPVV